MQHVHQFIINIEQSITSAAVKTSTESTRAEPAEACDQGGSAAKVLSGTHADWLLFCYWLRTCMAGRHEARLSWEACLLKHDTTGFSLPLLHSLAAAALLAVVTPRTHAPPPRRRDSPHLSVLLPLSHEATAITHIHSYTPSSLPPSPIHRRLGTAPSSFVWRPVLSLIQRHDIDCRLAFPH